MESAGIGWTDIGDAIEGDGDGKFTEAEMQELAQIARAEGVADGIKIGQARTSNGGSNGHLTLPQADEMAHYCHQRLSQLKNDREREFIDEMVVKTRRGRSLSPRTLGYLASIYIGIGGRV